MQNTENKHTKALNSSYKTKVTGMFLGLLVFVLVYLSLVAAASWFLYWSIAYPLPRWSIISIGFKIGIVTMAATLLVFLLKFLFHRRKVDYSQYTEIRAENYPELFKFIQEISQAADAPMPKKVFVDASINAKVFYDKPALGWLKSSNKNLLIGLGLVNGINLSEFKAVLAHEFGHFTQRSMRLGTYSHMINQSIYAMVYQKDRIDQFIEKWKYAGFIRLSMFAWALSPVLEFIRLILIIMANRLNYLQSSMSRQMEFQADLVAVRLAGSNALVNTLYKLTNLGTAFQFALQQIDMAVENGLITDNIFEHYPSIHKYLIHYDLNYAKKDISKRKVLNEKASYLFRKNDLSVPDMYASHPPSYYRELNAKQNFIVAKEDHRTAWVLFRKAQALQQWVSQRFMHQRLNNKTDKMTLEFVQATKVEQFIQEELDSIKLSNNYLGVYGNGRLLTVIDVEKPDRYNNVKDTSLV
ncbi:MAG: M48 family metallopeptidase, partial [Saprospiraceae bacterium]|nr:M48 family metallopeptidase [Saprospiraceae bacterium]